MVAAPATPWRRVLHAAAPYILRPEEKREFVHIVSNIRTPTNYVGAIHKRLQDGKLQYMKTHDYHVLMQQARPQIILYRSIHV